MENPFGIDPTTLSREYPVTFPGPAGTLEGLWRPPSPGHAAQGVIVVAHPHPAYQGTMLNKVVFHLARVFNHNYHFASLRFNFRGVGASEGSYDEGHGEIEDVVAAWEEARRRIPQGVFLASGFSFGSAMTVYAAARVNSHHITPSALALVGIPMRLFDLPSPFPHPVPLAAAHGEYDQFTPPSRIEDYLRHWSAPWSLHVEPHGDHFLTGRLPGALGFLSEALREHLV